MIDFPAGADLDRIIARRWFGVRVVKQRHRDCWDLVIPGGVNQIDWTTPDAPWSGCPHYSTDLGLAWKIFDKVYDKGGMGRIETLSRDGVTREIHAVISLPNTAHHEAFADTPALAICRAALDAAGEIAPRVG